MRTLLHYLTTPNPEVRREGLRAGPNTFPVGDYDIEGVEPWLDFSYETIMDCFGDILTTPVDDDLFNDPPPIAAHDLNLTDESSVTFILTKRHHTIIDCALQIAQDQLKDRGFGFPISWSLGSRSHVQEDPRLRPDWAVTNHSGKPPYEDLGPGDTKQSKKWNTSMKDSRDEHMREEFEKALRQVHLYSIRVNCRSCFLISDLELVWLRRRKSPEPARPLSTSRPRRLVSQENSRRVTSITSVLSGTSSMSLDSSGSPYTDGGNPDINEGPFEMCVVPWSNHGVGNLTINLAMFAAALWAATDNSVRESYPPLASWERIRGPSGEILYRQVGSLKIASTLPPDAILSQPEQISDAL
ncbi:uncharacterized protein PV07_12578 [Cladophialophora immunda]|uniref:Uncharacterized protein n=1 Tax=Cladophialophora immunda TaxID=569365 RepID=A0A0D2BUF8_9EURO|nr:uncharacterized protein PV07_12578 [Cladophialophora immunda]KIW22020.1 hypothetical protein PV07_12578 [Cladophialophora immunda]